MSKYIKRNKVRTLLIAFLLLFVLVVSVANSRMLSPYFIGPISFGGTAFVAGDVLLLESGDYLLLESGDKLLLE